MTPRTPAQAATKALLHELYQLREANADDNRDAVYQAFIARILAIPSRVLVVNTAEILTMITRHLIDEYTLDILPPHVAPTDAGQLTAHACHIHQHLTNSLEEENKE